MRYVDIYESGCLETVFYDNFLFFITKNIEK